MTHDNATHNNYQSLQSVLNKALQRASKGKGAQRHGENKPFEEQDICTELDALGLSPAIYQIRKKAKEALRLEPSKAANEFLDIIVYAAAAYIYLGKQITLNDKEVTTSADTPY